MNGRCSACRIGQETESITKIVKARNVEEGPPGLLPCSGILVR